MYCTPVTIDQDCIKQGVESDEDDMDMKTCLEQDYNNDNDATSELQFLRKIEDQFLNGSDFLCLISYDFLIQPILV